MTRKVLMPAFAGDPVVETLFVEAGFVVDYALDAEERALGRVVPKRKAIRDAAMRPALETKLSDASALNGMAVGEPLLVDAALIARAPKLEVVFIGAAGYDRIDTAAATEAGILVFNAPGGNADVVAEHTLGLMLALSRHIVDSDRRAHATGKALTRQDIQTSGWSLGMLKGRTLGLLGFGFVGQQVAQRALLGFGMNVIAYDPFFDKEEARRQGVTLFDTPDAVCAQADVLSLHVPLTEQTRNLVDSRMLSLMKNSAFLINTARGASVDTEALVDALRARRIAAAALDVTEPEPLPEGHALFALENTIVTPHIAGAAPETFAKSAVIAAELAIKGLRGERSPHLVNPDAWKRNRERFGQAGS
jgi:D-3-phosphoglycerate dehydrogenase